MDERLARVERMLKYEFENKQLLEAAITHPSAVEGKSISASYERLEFLGDAILGALVSEELFLQYPESDEGVLTRYKISLVSGETLSDLGDDLDLEELIFFGESERGTGSRGMHSALENVIEALIGALYLDGGLECARSFINEHLMDRLSDEKVELQQNPKSRLQELTQALYKCAPEYKLVGEKGPAHNPTFSAEVYLRGKKLGEGSGNSKKSAESAAALAAIEKLERKNS